MLACLAPPLYPRDTPPTLPSDRELMATARNLKPQPKPAAPRKVAELSEPAPLHPVLRAFDEVYRFLASVKLAVICIATLAMVLAGATIFESGYGIPASREYVYQNKAFAVLLAFLAANIFCAATIRFPWKKRQIGFVVTHIGLLVILAGAFVSLSSSDEGQLVISEGGTSNEVVRIEHSILRVEKYDPASGKWGDSYVLPFTHGAFSWHSGDLAKLGRDSGYQTKVWLTRLALGASAALFLAFVFVWAVRRPAWLDLAKGAFLASALIGLNAGLGVMVLMTPSGPRREVLTDVHDPFRLVVKDYLASSGQEEMRADPDPLGYPAVKLALLVKPPGTIETVNGLEGRDWFGAPTSSFERTFRDGQPAAVSYQLAKGPHAANAVDDFLHPPTKPLVDSAVRIHYLDDSKMPRVYEWIVGQNEGAKTVTLPGTDFKATLGGPYSIPTDSDEIAPLVGMPESASGRARAAESILQATGERSLYVVVLTVERGPRGKKIYAAVASLPNLPNSKLDEPDDPIQSVSFATPPRLSSKGAGMGGRLAQIDVLQTEDGKFYARGFGRDGLMGEPGPIEVGKKVPLIASARMPMQVALRIDEVLPRAVIRKEYVPVELAREDRDKAMPAVQAEMTVKGLTRPVSLLRVGNDLRSIDWQTVEFPDATYRVALDFDRLSLPFTMGLIRFEPGKDPGSPTPATYRSDVTLSDSELDVKDEPHAIFMNNTLTHRGWTFYQSSFGRATDPQTGQKGAVYASIFQVHYDPAWKIIYSGCLCMVIGIFLQFYMRAGLFSDGGRRERAIAAAKAGTASPSDSANSGEPAEDL